MHFFKTAEELFELLNQRSQSSYHLEDEHCAKKMKKIAMERYTWGNIVKEYEKLY